MNSTVLCDTKQIDLTTLAGEINREHDQAITAARTALEHARACGELLIQAKTQVGHGGFLEWLEANCRVKPRQSQKYMKLAREWPTIEAKCEFDAHLTIDGALALTNYSSRQQETPWSLRDAKKVAIKRLEIEACLGALFDWAAQNDVRQSHKLIHWLCPAQGWMNKDRARDLLLDLMMRDTVQTSPNEPRQSVSDVISEVACCHVGIDPLNASDPTDGFPVICMCDVAIAVVKFTKDLAPCQEPVRMAPCCEFGEACIFGIHTRPDPAGQRALIQSLDDWYAGKGPCPCPELFGEEVAV